MDLSQLAARVTWLDEERRKDKAEIAALAQRVLGTEQALREAVRRVQELESALAAAQAVLARLPRADEALDKMRTEIVLMIEEQEERRKAAERETERLRRLELEAQAKALADLKRELAVIPRMQEEIAPRKTEEQRLNAMLAALSQEIAQLEERVDARVRDVSYLEESRRQDNRRLTELQVEMTELRKRVDAAAPKLEVVQEQVVRNHARVSELVALETERKQDHTRFAEQYAMLFRDRDRRMEDWSAQLAEAQRRMEEYARRVEAYAELQQIVNTVLAQIEGLRQRLEQRQNEVAEMQRLGDERAKQQWLEFVAEQDRRWKHQAITTDEHWRDHDRRHEDFGQALEELRGLEEQLKSEITRLWRLQEAHAQTMTVMVRQWLEDFEQQAERAKLKG